MAPGDPFHSRGELKARVGADVKVNLTSNLTLDATINPDFGQVEVDPARVNLSAFEQFFQERRPFFLEGKEIFNSPLSVFYSRTIVDPASTLIDASEARRLPPIELGLVVYGVVCAVARYEAEARGLREG